MFERFTDRARRVLVLSQEEARLLGHSFIGTEHVLLGLIHEGDGIAAKTLESFGITLEAVRAKVDEFIGPGGAAATESPPFTPRAKKILELALREALQLGNDHIGTEHLLLGVLREDEGVAAQVLREVAPLDDIRLRVITFIREMGPSESEWVNSNLNTRLSVAPDESPGEPHRWQHPVRVVSGSDAHLTSEAIEFRVVGALVYDDGIRILWRISEIPSPVADLIQKVNTIRGAHPFSAGGNLTLADDVETVYMSSSGSFEPQRDGEWAGECYFTPMPPDTAHKLLVGWEGQSIQLPVL